MAAKLVALLALLGTTAWWSRAPDWGTAVAVLTALAGLITLEVRDRKNLGRTRERKEQHDNALFSELDTILPERLLLDQLNGPLYNNETTASFLRRLHEFRQLAELTGSTFIVGSIQAAFAEYRRKVEELHGFLIQHFFREERPGTADDARYVLYPDLKREHETEGAVVYQQRRAELLSLLDEAATSLEAFRSTVKSELSC